MAARTLSASRDSAGRLSGASQAQAKAVSKSTRGSRSNQGFLPGWPMLTAIRVVHLAACPGEVEGEHTGQALVPGRCDTGGRSAAGGVGRAEPRARWMCDGTPLGGRHASR